MADMPLLPLEREGSVVVLARCNSPLIGEDRAAVAISISHFVVLEKVVMIISHLILRVKGSGGGHDHICKSSPQKRQGRRLLMIPTFLLL